MCRVAKKQHASSRKPNAEGAWHQWHPFIRASTLSADAGADALSKAGESMRTGPGGRTAVSKGLRPHLAGTTAQESERQPVGRSVAYLLRKLHTFLASSMRTMSPTCIDASMSVLVTTAATKPDPP